MRKECDVACIRVVFLIRQVELSGVKTIEELFLRNVYVLVAIALLGR